MSVRVGEIYDERVHGWKVKIDSIDSRSVSYHLIVMDVYKELTLNRFNCSTDSFKERYKKVPILKAKLLYEE